MFQEATSQLSRSWKYHCLESVEIETHPHYNKAGRPTKNQSPEYCTYGVTAQVVTVKSAIEIARRRARRFVLATNVLDEDVLSNDAEATIPNLKFRVVLTSKKMLKLKLNFKKKFQK